MSEETEFEQEQDTAVDADRSSRFSEAVLFSSDWTVETVLSQLHKGNIQLNPNFQRREAWSNVRKSRFIESVFIGLPIPQLVLAEIQGQRGRYIVLDGKQRLLSLLRFTESAENRELGFGLSNLEIRSDLSRKKYFHFINNPELENDRDQFLNYTIRTVIIRNWPNADFLHQVFLRLNTGSVTLSAQELRQAMAPGEFTSFADDYSAQSNAIQGLLGRDTPDPRMRDVELLVRHIAFKGHLTEYKGRLKAFLDDVCVSENRRWLQHSESIQEAARQFEEAIRVLSQCLGDRLARKPNSRSFNRAIFDALSYYASQPEIRAAMSDNPDTVSRAYNEALENADFLEAVESDTAGIPNTISRLQIWGSKLQEALEIPIQIPSYDRDSRTIVIS